MISSTEFLLKCPTASCCFPFGKRISYFLICSIILLNAHSASAFFSDDRIDGNFSYRSLHVEILKTKTKTKTKSKRDGCYLVGEILNNTNIVREDVSVTFFAYDFFDHTLWKQTIHIDIIDPFYNSRKGHAFRKKLSRCDVPAKFQFKVSGVKGKDTQKAVKDKPKTKPKAKDSDSRNSRQKEDLSADVVPGSETPAVLIRKYLIILTNGKQVATDSFREHDNMVIFHQDGGEVQISKDKVAEIRTPN